MTIFELSPSQLRRAVPVSFREIGISERGDLQRLLRAQVEVIAPETFVVCEEFGQWEESSRRIDLLAIDRAANLVVIELKRTDDGGHMELQALRYAAMVSTMTFAQAVEAHRKFRLEMGMQGDALEAMLTFLGWADADEDRFGQDTRIVLAAEDFSREITTTVMWLNQRSLDIRCVRMKPYQLDGLVLLDVQQLIPLPEAADYQVRVREKIEVARSARTGVRWDESAFMNALSQQRGDAEREVAEDLLRWAESACDRIAWGSGAQLGSFIVGTTAVGRPQYLFAVWTHGYFEVYFQHLKSRQPFAEPSLREELRARLNVIPGVQLPPDATAKRPNLRLSLFEPTESRQTLKATFEWVMQVLAGSGGSDRSDLDTAAGPG